MAQMARKVLMQNRHTHQGLLRYDSPSSSANRSRILVSVKIPRKCRTLAYECLAETVQHPRRRFVRPSMVPSLGVRVPFVHSSPIAADLLLLRRYSNKYGVNVIAAAKKQIGCNRGPKPP